MGLVSRKSPETEGGCSMSFRPMKSKWKLYRPEISSHPIISGVPNVKESDHLIIKRRRRNELISLCMTARKSDAALYATGK
ncbi:hypothetical protein J4Q44_G00014850 [Coregonus suidteri]|uniref:Uncharacterized protein n=1 Tax=Coregonus suidteri TaxID=861788 RepID=A0AAN8MNX2_9TELE